MASIHPNWDAIMAYMHVMGGRGKVAAPAY